MLDRVIDLVGGQAELARKVGVSPQVVNGWCKRNRVAASKAVAVEQAVEGRVTRYDLRPDIFGEPPQPVA